MKDAVRFFEDNLIFSKFTLQLCSAILSEPWFAVNFILQVWQNLLSCFTTKLTQPILISSGGFLILWRSSSLSFGGFLLIHLIHSLRCYNTLCTSPGHPLSSWFPLAILACEISVIIVVMSRCTPFPSLGPPSLFFCTMTVEAISGHQWNPPHLCPVRD